MRQHAGGCASEELVELLSQLLKRPREGDFTDPGFGLIRLMDALIDHIAAEASASGDNRQKLVGVREQAFGVLDHVRHGLFVEHCHRIAACGLGTAGERDILASIDAVIRQATSWEFSFGNDAEEERAVLQLIETRNVQAARLFGQLVALNKHTEGDRSKDKQPLLKPGREERGKGEASTGGGGEPKVEIKNRNKMELLASALVAHHQYDDTHDYCKKLVPIAGKLLSTQTGVSTGWVSKFFEVEFGSHADYKALCQRNPGKLAGKLKGFITPRAELCKIIAGYQAELNGD